MSRRKTNNKSEIKTNSSLAKTGPSSMRTGPSTMKTGASSTVYPSTVESTIVRMPYDRFGVDTFHFWNGDVYEGEFWATTEKTYQEFHLYRDGYGEYRTADGQMYVTVEWRQDLVPPGSWMEIYYPDGGRYAGEVRDLAYNGPGSYVFRDCSMLHCWWQDGRPRPLPIPTITDPYGRRWLALPQVQTKENDLCFVAPVRFLPVEPEEEEEFIEEAEGDIVSTEEEEEVPEEELATEPEVSPRQPLSTRAASRRP